MAGEAPTTELEAVNTMLSTIGESPVDSLEFSGLLLAENARSILKETSRAVQTKSWHFNSEEDYPLARDVDGYINIPTNALRVDTTEEYSTYDVVVRGTRLYNRKEHTYVFDKTLKVDITFFLPFEQMPEAARYYTLIRAARIFQDREVNSNILHEYTANDELAALILLEEAEGNSADLNILTGHISLLNTVLR